MYWITKALSWPAYIFRKKEQPPRLLEIYQIAPVFDGERIRIYALMSDKMTVREVFPE